MPAGQRGDETGSREPGSLIFDYHPGASEELIEAARFYETRETGLGRRFLDAVDASLAFLRDNPTLRSADERGRRRWLVHKFPYLIIYKLEDPFFHILAVAHTSRKPGYWAHRDSGSKH